jgi:probable HAF family extracellular repeat protein
MKTQSLNFRMAASLLMLLAVTTSLFAQDKQNHKPQHYKLYLVPPPGGGADSLSICCGLHVLNNGGTLASFGYTSIPDPFFGFVIHETRTREGVSTELASLPPSIMNTAGAASINDNGIFVGGSENGQIDPLTGFPEFEAVTWNDTSIVDLGNFGGNGSLALSINNRGQIVGYALNNIPDPYGLFLNGCSTFQCFPVGQQMRATLWDRGKLRDLGTLGGNDAEAVRINEAGQVAGTSYTNTIPNQTTGIPSQDPFFWERGKMLDVGNLGGTFAYTNSMNQSGQVVGLSTLAGDAVSHPFTWQRGNLTDIGTFGGTYGEAFAVNDAGEVVGRANLAGDQVHHAFLWRKGVLTDLGTLGGRNSTAYAINSNGQIVGASLLASDATHAFLWEKGSGMVDLNDFIPPGSGLYLQAAYYINDRGQISGDAFLDNGHERAYLLTPCGENDDCTSDMFIADTVAGVAPTGVVRTTPTGDEQIGSFADLRRELEQRHRLPAQIAKPSN